MNELLHDRTNVPKCQKSVIYQTITKNVTGPQKCDKLWPRHILIAQVMRRVESYLHE